MALLCPVGNAGVLLYTPHSMDEASMHVAYQCSISDEVYDCMETCCDRFATQAGSQGSPSQSDTVVRENRDLCSEVFQTP